MIHYVFVMGTPSVVTPELAQGWQQALPETVCVYRPRPRMRAVSHRYLCGALRRSDILSAANRYAAHVRRRMHRSGRLAFIQIDPDAFGFAGVLESTFTMPCLIHLVCHPFTCVEQHLRQRQPPCCRLLDYLLPYRRMRGDVCGDSTRDEWAGLSSIEQSAWYWEKVNGFLDAAGSRMRHYKRVRIEDLYANPEAAAGLLRFCGLGEVPPVMTLTQPAPAAPPLETWPQEIRDAVKNRCRRLAERFGYDLDRPL